jgi:hypothetical protein
MSSESSTANQELSQLRKKMQESYVQAQREKSELTDQMRQMEERLKRLREEAEENEKHLKIELKERTAENKLLTSSLQDQTSINQTLDEGNKRMQENLRSKLTRMRSGLDSSRLLDSSLLNESLEPNTPEKSAHSPYDRSILSKSLKDGKQDEEAALLDDFGSEIERIKSAIQNAETLNAQLMAKVTNLDTTLLEQKVLNHTLQQEVAKAHEDTGKMSESEQRVKSLEAKIAKQQDKITKLEERLEKVKKMAQEELQRELAERDKVRNYVQEHDENRSDHPCFDVCSLLC